MTNVFAETFRDASGATITVWAVLMLLSLPALLMLASPQAIRDPQRAALGAFGLFRRRREDRERWQAEAVAAVRYAGEVAVAADRAALAVQRWDECWRQADDQAGRAWQRWQDAERQLTRLRSGAAFRPAWNPRTPSEYAERERYLHRAVQDAVFRGDLPGDALGRFDARLHPVDQELAVARAVAAHRQRMHERAEAAEQTAWHDAQLAVSARDSLRRESRAASARAAELHRHLPRRAVETAPVRARGLVRQPA
jgi:hypothetical protein